MAPKCLLLIFLAQHLLLRLAAAGGPAFTTPFDKSIDLIFGPATAPIAARFLDTSSCSVVCLNGGVPVVRTEGRDCLCQCPTVGNATFIGTQCQTPATLCNTLGFYCTNGGACVAPSNLQQSWSCQCPSPYYGFQCKSSGVTCGSTVCYNGGQCQDLKCACPTGFGGNDCSQPGGNAAATATSIISPGPTLSKTDSGGGGTKWYVILIVVVGRLVLVAVLVLAVVFVFRRPRREKRMLRQFQKLVKQHSISEGQTQWKRQAVAEEP